MKIERILNSRGIYYRRDDIELGPYTTDQDEDADFDVKLANAFGVEVKDIFAARIKNPNAKIPIDTVTQAINQTAFLGNLRLVVKGEKVFLLDESNNALWSCNAQSVDSPQKKKQLAELTHQSDSEIDRVTAQLLFSLERQHDDHESEQIKDGLNSVGEGITLSSEEVAAKGLELLKSGQLLYSIKQVYDKGVQADKYRFVLWEDDKKLLTAVNCVSSKSRWAQSEFVDGSSGFGKSNMVIVALCLIPSSWSKILTYVTPAALRYSSNQDYSILFIREHRQTGEQDIRLMKSEDGGYTWEIAVRDSETGQMTTQTGRIPAKTTIETGTHLESVENLRRDWLVSVDETPELTREINRRKAEFRAGKIKPTSPDDIAIIQSAISQLDLGLDVVIPYAEYLEDLTTWDRSRFDDLLDMISIIALIHQKQRPLDNEGRIIATAADLYLALRISAGTLLESLQKLPVRLEKCLEAMPGTLQGDGATCKTLALELKKAQGTIRQYLSELENLGYAVSDQKQGTREKQYWKVPSPSIGTADVLLKKAFSSQKWQNIALSVQTALKQADCRSAELLNGVWTVVDPLATGTVVRLERDDVEIPPSAVQQFMEKANSKPSEEKNVKIKHSPAEPEIQQQISSIRTKLQKLKVFSWDYAIEQAMKVTNDRSTAESYLEQLRDSGQLIQDPDPDGNWRYYRG